MSVPSGTKFIGISPNVDTLERKSAQANSPSQVYTIEDLASSVTLQAVLDNNHDLVDGNNFQGTDAGNGNQGSYVNAFGFEAASANEGIHVNALGESAASQNQGNYVNALGVSAASQNQGENVNAFGSSAACKNTGSNVVAIGQNAGYQNVLNNSFIVANTEMPSYLNYAAANAAISVLGIAGNTYLYHDQTTNSIGAVRL